MLKFMLLSEDHISLKRIKLHIFIINLKHTGNAKKNPNMIFLRKHTHNKVTSLRIVAFCLLKENKDVSYARIKSHTLLTMRPMPNYFNLPYDVKWRWLSLVALYNFQKKNRTYITIKLDVIAFSISFLHGMMHLLQ